MLKEERLNFIENYVNRHKFVSFHNLMHVLNVSKATIRRDLQSLSDDNRLILVRGGASSKNSPIITELPYDQKQEHFESEKIRIAQAAADLVKPDHTIVLDSGTTVRKMVPFLAQIPRLHILTCDIAIASDLSYYPGVNVTVTGGNLRQGYFNLTGYYAEAFMRGLHADIAFCGFDSVSPTGGCMLTNIEEVGIKKQIIASADRVVVLSDHTKFGKDTVVKVCGISEVSLFITGNELSDEIVDRFDALHPLLMRV